MAFHKKMSRLPEKLRRHECVCAYFPKLNRPLTASVFPLGVGIAKQISKTIDACGISTPRTFFARVPGRNAVCARCSCGVSPSSFPVVGRRSPWRSTERSPPPNRVSPGNAGRGFFCFGRRLIFHLVIPRSGRIVLARRRRPRGVNILAQTFYERFKTAPKTYSHGDARLHGTSVCTARALPAEPSSPRACVRARRVTGRN